MPNGARGRAGPQLRSSRQAALAASILNLDSEEQAGQENNLSCYIDTIGIAVSWIISAVQMLNKV